MIYEYMLCKKESSKLKDNSYINQFIKVKIWNQ